MIEIDLFKRLLEKYKFIEVIPEEVQKYVVRSRKRVLKSSLKAVNDLGFFYSFVISVYFRARNIGFRPSVFTSKIIALLLTLAIIGLIIAGGVIASVNIFDLNLNEDPSSHWTIEDRNERIEDKKHIETDESDETAADILNEPKSTELKKTKRRADNSKRKIRPGDKRSLNIKARLGVTTLIPRGVDKNETDTVSRKLLTSLQKLKGKKNVIYLGKDRKQKNVNRQLMGRLSRLGSSYVLSVRVVNSSTGDVLYDNAITYKKDDTIDSNISDMAQEINNIASIWE